MRGDTVLGGCVNELFNMAAKTLGNEFNPLLFHYVNKISCDNCKIAYIRDKLVLK